MNHRHEALLDLLCLANCLSREFESSIAEQYPAGISHINVQILSYLKAHEGENIFQKDIEEVFSIRRSTVSKIVRLMEEKGLLLRVPVAHDARLKCLKLTEKAHRLSVISAQALSVFEKRATQQLSDSEVLSLLTLLHKIDSTLNQRHNEENL